MIITGIIPLYPPRMSRAYLFGLNRDTILPVRTYAARLTEIQVDAAGRLSAWIICPSVAIPPAGQYTLAYAPGDPLAALAVPLFQGGGVGGVETAGRGFLAAPPLPWAWAPGTDLILRGPLGRGFNLDGQRLALAALGDSVARLLPLAGVVLQRGGAVTLFTGAPFPTLPAAIEIYPLGSLPEALAWADCLAVDLPLESLPVLRPGLGLKKGERLPLPAQALVYTPMPCGGLAVCGACAVPARGVPPGYYLACTDGPVFDLSVIDW